MEIPIQVAVRLKPVTNVNDMVCAHPVPYNSSIQLGSQHSYPVSYALPIDCSQSYMFLTTLQPLVNCLLDGVDVSVVAFGQAGSGKTYTLLGPGLHCAYSESEHGLIPRFIREVFIRLAQHHDRNTIIQITWTQICGENIQDLLGTGSVEVCNVSDAFHWLQLGMANMAPNHAHSLFTITIEQQWIVDSTIEHRISTASFADLCSSEKMLIMDNLGETRNIPTDNGLLTLQNVITALSDPYLTYQCVPYNQSTLTTLLKDSFGGRAKTLVICCLSPLLKDFNESLYTLQLAVKIQCIRNYVTTNSYTNACVETDLNSEQESLDRSTYDMFGLQFAVSQWMKLVTNAEDLFNKLVINKQLPDQELEQISEWLLLKQECEECLSSEETISIEALEPQRSLGRIEEENEVDNETSTTTPPNDLSESETESDMDPQRPDFLDKLDSFMQTFRFDTDHLVSEHYEDYLVNGLKREPKYETKSCDALNAVNGNAVNALNAVNRSCSPNEQLQAKGARGRRASIHPGEILLPDILSSDREIDYVTSDIEKLNIQEIVPVKYAESSDPLKQIKALSANAENKQKRLRQVVGDIEGAQKQIDKLQHTIQIKEQLIENMIKNGDTRSYAKQKFQKKRTKLEGEYYKARTQIAQAENNLLHCHSSNKLEYKEEVEKYKNIAAFYEKRLKDIESIKVITEDSARKILEYENSLHTSRKQMDRLKKQLRRDEKRKQSLEQELLEDKQKISELEQETSKLTIDGEYIREVSARISHLDQVLKEKSFDLQRTDDYDEKESLRHEIRNLRRTRDCLVEQRCHLDEKLKKEKMLSDTEERKLLECEEAIEAIDAAIEYKNELICGRKQMGNDRMEREKGEEMLMQRLMKLSEDEMRTLLYKYFQKVIDLRDSSKKLEMQVIQMERECEASVWRVQTLSHLLQQVRLESERRVVLLQQQHEDKLNLMMRHFTDETSASSDADRKVDRVMARMLERNQICEVAGSSRHNTDHPVVKCKQEGRHERVVAKYREETRDKNKFIAKFQELARYHTEKRRIHDTTIPQQNLKQLQSTSDSPATKVTRQKNKLIIQQSKPRK